MEVQDIDNNRYSVDSDENRDEPTEEMVWNLHDLLGGDHEGSSAK